MKRLDEHDRQQKPRRDNSVIAYQKRHAEQLEKRAAYYNAN